MTEKPKIQYIGQFYVPGSEAQVLAPKKKKKKHVQPTHFSEAGLTEAILAGRPTVNEEIRLFIRNWKKEREI